MELRNLPLLSKQLEYITRNPKKRSHDLIRDNRREVWQEKKRVYLAALKEYTDQIVKTRRLYLECQEKIKNINDEAGKLRALYVREEEKLNKEKLELDALRVEQLNQDKLEELRKRRFEMSDPVTKSEVGTFELAEVVAAQHAEELKLIAAMNKFETKYKNASEVWLRNRELTETVEKIRDEEVRKLQATQAKTLQAELVAHRNKVESERNLRRTQRDTIYGERKTDFENRKEEERKEKARIEAERKKQEREEKARIKAEREKKEREEKARKQEEEKEEAHKARILADIEQGKIDEREQKEMERQREQHARMKAQDQLATLEAYKALSSKFGFTKRDAEISRLEGVHIRMKEKATILRLYDTKTDLKDCNESVLKIEQSLKQDIASYNNFEKSINFDNKEYLVEELNRFQKYAQTQLSKVKNLQRSCRDINTLKTKRNTILIKNAQDEITKYWNEVPLTHDEAKKYLNKLDNTPLHFAKRFNQSLNDMERAKSKYKDILAHVQVREYYQTFKDKMEVARKGIKKYAQIAKELTDKEHSELFTEWCSQFQASEGGAYEFLASRYRTAKRDILDNYTPDDKESKVDLCRDKAGYLYGSYRDMKTIHKMYLNGEDYTKSDDKKYGPFNYMQTVYVDCPQQKGMGGCKGLFVRYLPREGKSKMVLESGEVRNVSKLCKKEIIEGRERKVKC